MPSATIIFKTKESIVIDLDKATCEALVKLWSGGEKRIWADAPYTYDVPIRKEFKFLIDLDEVYMIRIEGIND